MASDLDRYADWKAPAGDGQRVIWPDAARLAHLAAANREALRAGGGTLGGEPIADLRHAVRAALRLEPGALVVATGHQCELHHPGVWVKDVLIDALARTSGAVALHLAVDTDAPKHLTLRWPGGALPVSDDPAAAWAPWSGLLAAPSPEHAKAVRAAIADAARQWPFLPCATAAPPEAPMSRDARLPDYLLDRAAAFDAMLGLGVRRALLSPLLDSAAWARFVAAILADLPRFIEHYNAALAAYRAAVGIASPMRPMPDLLRNSDRIEAPFWLDDLAGGARARLMLERDGERWRLVAGTRTHAIADASPRGAEQLRAFLQAGSLRVAPRALTLTLLLRLCVADLFVHGIGGGRYDQVTDRLIETYVGARLPGFAVATATLWFPTAGSETRVCVPCLAMEGHRLRHEVLGPRRRETARAIAALPRGSAQRSELFMEMHRARRARLSSDAALRAWGERMADARRRAEHQAVLFDRELWVALQPAERLARLVEQVRGDVAG